MALETGTYISDLVITNPTPTDFKRQGDDHLRLLKSTIKATFPNVSGAVTPTHTELNYVDGVTSNIQTQLDAITTLADGKIYVGNGSNVATEVTPSGDVTMSNAGVTAIGAAKVTKTMLNSNVAATSAEMITGTATDVFATPDATDGLFTDAGRRSIGTSGYQKLPGGLIIQWGSFTTSSSGYTNITFPIAFPTAFLNITGTASAGDGEILIPMFYGDTATTTTVPCQTWGVNQNRYAKTVFWQAIGY